MEKRTKKIITIGMILLLIVGLGICIVDAGKIKEGAKTIIKIATGEAIEDVIKNAQEINDEIQKIKVNMGTYDKCIELCNKNIEKLNMARDKCIEVINNPNEKSYNIDYCKDKIIRIEGILKMTELKKEAAKRAIAKAT